MAVSFGRKINKKRLEKDLSLRDLANLTGLDHSYIARLEKGGPLPSRETVTKLSVALDIPTNELMIAAGYLPDIRELGELGTDGYIKKHGFQKLAETTSEYSIGVEIDREIQAFQEKGINIDRASAQKIVEHRHRIMQGEEEWLKYILEAKGIGEAIERLMELNGSLDFDDATLIRFIRKAKEKFDLPTPIETDPAAHGPKGPGTGIFDNKEIDNPKA